MNRYLAINIEGEIGQPTVIRTSSFIIKRIGGVIVSMLAVSVLAHKLELKSDETKEHTISPFSAKY